ncbi:hypothetical protein [Herbaspirillum camelliae]|uniref:hypothetical protein n=1 Tax=Herbaspirillum camelliae TaxID=1892903 RepID=UPI00117B97F9|nr:hypothetical protein [Herbaspirillum camelliae]
MTKAGKKKPNRQHHRSPPLTGPHSTAQPAAASATDEASLGLFLNLSLALLRNTGHLFRMHKKLPPENHPKR